MKISVIVPVGNRSLYRNCRASILRSIELAKECDWELVEVFDDDRRGVAWARNEGVDRATGEYVGWVDCDDEVTERWATAIAEGLKGDGVDMLAFDAHAKWDDGRGEYDLVYGRPAGNVVPRSFAKDVIGAGRAGGWLWNKVFRRQIFDGRRFEGNAFQDYRMMCEILPTVESVKYLPEKLYIYHRNATGISQYVNRAASLNALEALVGIADVRKDAYAGDMRRGVAVQVADFCRHAGGEPVFRRFLRRQLWRVWTSSDVAFRIKVKCFIEAFKL